MRPLTFLDMRKMKRTGSYAPSPDGNWMLYTMTVPNWKSAEDQSDIHLVSLKDGLSSHKQMTFTEEKSERSPAWSMDGSYFVFISNRDGDKNQLFMMRPDGGEARKITKSKEGISNFEFSRDGKWLVYRSGKDEDIQLYALATDNLGDAEEPKQLTSGDTGIQDWEISPGSDRIYFTRPDHADTENITRKEKGFTVDVKNYETPLESLWYLDLDSKEEHRITNDDSYTVSRFTISDDGKWVAFSSTSSDRYKRNITEQRINADIFLYKVIDNSIERLTNNNEVSESLPSFSPDGRWVAFVSSDDMSGYNMKSRKVYIRSVENRGGVFRKLGTKFNDHLGIGFWSEDGNTIYFNAGIKVTRQLMSLDVNTGEVIQITNEKARMAVSEDENTGVLMINYSDPMTPSTMYTMSSLDQVTDRQSWTQVTDANPELNNLALGKQYEINYTSTDGKEVGGVVVLPVGYEEGKRYPLVVSIHGGPAGADYLSFNENSGQVYAGAGYVMFCPNYRGSTNYGEAHRTDIVGNYFPQAFDDIMAGVDYLIDEGIVDGNRMGAMGWSAGGHWSNWILTHTDRFKAISSGAGTMNWISMYAQSDVQRNRRYYLGDTPMYEDFEPFWEQSPLKYIKNAKTPTMVHVVAGDPRVPSPQSVELHMALKKLGVDTELFMYPGRSHGIPDTRNRLVKAVSEMAWMDYYVRGIGEKFSWQQVLETLEEEKAEEKKEEEAGSN
ncbi:MAG: S9 family peptidase [Saprospiraceae bacterium]|nr:S9 family peptidase [Saprospiraceae bacterium]